MFTMASIDHNNQKMSGMYGIFFLVITQYVSVGTASATNGITVNENAVPSRTIGTRPI